LCNINNLFLLTRQSFIVLDYFYFFWYFYVKINHVIALFKTKSSKPTQPLLVFYRLAMKIINKASLTLFSIRQ